MIVYHTTCEAPTIIPRKVLVVTPPTLPTGRRRADDTTTSLCYTALWQCTGKPQRNAISLAYAEPF